MYIYFQEWPLGIRWPITVLLLGKTLTPYPQHSLVSWSSSTPLGLFPMYSGMSTAVVPSQLLFFDGQHGTINPWTVPRIILAIMWVLSQPYRAATGIVRSIFPVSCGMRVLLYGRNSEVKEKRKRWVSDTRNKKGKLWESYCAGQESPRLYVRYLITALHWVWASLIFPFWVTESKGLL